MSTAENERVVLEPEQVQEARDRTSMLLHEGYEYADARIIGRRLDVSLHDAVALVRNGCPSQTARRILL